MTVCDGFCCSKQIFNNNNSNNINNNSRNRNRNIRYSRGIIFKVIPSMAKLITIKWPKVKKKRKNVYKELGNSI